MSGDGPGKGEADHMIEEVWARLIVKDSINLNYCRLPRGR